MRRTYRLTNIDPKQVFSLDWPVKTFTVRNYTKMVVWINVGSDDFPTSLDFTDYVAPFHAIVIDPVESTVFAVNVDNAGDPTYVFPLPVAAVFSSGGSSVQMAMGAV